MNETKISESGMIGSDGRLKLPMDRLNAFFAAHKGKRVIARFEVAEPGTTIAQLAYYYNYILPTISYAMKELGTRIEGEHLERFLFSQYPARPHLDNGDIVEHGRQLTKQQMSDYLDWLKQYAAENLCVYIEDSKTI